MCNVSAHETMCQKPGETSSVLLRIGTCAHVVVVATSLNNRLFLAKLAKPKTRNWSHLIFSLTFTSYEAGDNLFCFISSQFIHNESFRLSSPQNRINKSHLLLMQVHKLFSSRTSRRKIVIISLNCNQMIHSNDHQWIYLSLHILQFEREQDYHLLKVLISVWFFFFFFFQLAKNSMFSQLLLMRSFK